MIDDAFKLTLDKIFIRNEINPEDQRTNTSTVHNATQQS